MQTIVDDYYATYFKHTKARFYKGVRVSYVMLVITALLYSVGLFNWGMLSVSLGMNLGVVLLLGMRCCLYKLRLDNYLAGLQP